MPHDIFNTDDDQQVNPLDFTGYADLPKPEDSSFSAGVDETITNLIAQQKKNDHEAFAQAAQGRANEAQKAREAGLGPEAQTSASYLSFDQVESFQKHSPVFYKNFISDPDFSSMTGDRLDDSSFLERSWDYSSDFARSMRVGARNFESSYLGMKHLINAELSGTDRERLNFLGVTRAEDLQDIERDAAGNLRNQLNPLNWPIAVGEQVINFGGAYLFSQIGAGIGGVGGGFIGTLGAPDVSDVATVPIGVAAGKVVGQAAGVMGFTGFLEGGALFNELVEERERRGEEIDYNELRRLAIGGGLINGAFEAAGMAVMSRLIPKSLRDKMDITDTQAAVRQLFGTKAGAKAASGIFRRYTESLATEAGTEAFQEMVNALAVEFDAGGLKDTADSLRFMGSNETMSRVGHAAFKGFQVAAVLGGGATTYQGASSYSETAKSRKQIENIVRSDSNVRATQEGFEWLHRANEFAVKNQEMIKQNPEQVAAYVEQVAQETGITEVHMGSETLRDILDTLGNEESTRQTEVDAGVRPDNEIGETGSRNFDKATLYHSTDEESAENITEGGFQVVGDGFYGDAISLTGSKDFSRTFGDTTIEAKVKPSAKILDLSDTNDWKVYKNIENSARYQASSPTSAGAREDQETRRDVFKANGVDGVYDDGAGDLFIFNEKVIEVGKNEAPQSPQSDDQESGKVSALANLERALGENLGSLSDKAESGDSITISMQDYIVNIAGNKTLREAVAADIKLDRNHYTKKEVGAEIKHGEEMRETFARAEEEHNRLLEEQDRVYREVILPEHQAANVNAGNPKPQGVVEANAFFDSQIVQARATAEGITIEEALKDRAPIEGVQDIEGELHTQAFFQSFSDTYGGTAIETRREMEAMEDSIINADGKVIVPSGYGYVGEGEVSNLNPFQSKLVRTTAFANWFKDSKIVDINGEPKVVYHGRMNDAESIDFTQRETGFGITGNMGASNYFSTSPEDSSKNYAHFDPNSLGGDIVNKIEQETVRIQEAYAMNPEGYKGMLKSAYPLETFKNFQTYPFEIMDRDLHAMNELLEIPITSLTKPLEDYDLDEERVASIMKNFLNDLKVDVAQVAVIPANGQFIEIQTNGELVEALRRLNYETVPVNIVWYEDLEWKTANRIAEKRVIGTGGNVVPAFLSIQNPLTASVPESRMDLPAESESTYFDFQLDEIENMKERIEDGEDFTQELQEAETRRDELRVSSTSATVHAYLDQDVVPSDELVNFIEALEVVLAEFDSSRFGDIVATSENVDNLIGLIQDKGWLFEGVRASDLEETLREFVYAEELSTVDKQTDKASDMVSGQFFRRIAEEMGYDGIVDLDPRGRFGNMPGVQDDTNHIVTFQGNQQKSASGNVTFDPTTTRMHLQRQEPRTINTPGLPVLRRKEGEEALPTLMEDIKANEMERATERVLREPRLQSRIMSNLIKSKQGVGDKGYWFSKKEKKGRVTYSGVLAEGAKAEEIEFTNLEYVINKVTENGTKAATQEAITDLLQNYIVQIKDYAQPWTIHGPANFTEDQLALHSDKLIGSRSQASSRPLPFDQSFNPEAKGLATSHWSSQKIPAGSRGYFESLFQWNNATGHPFEYRAHYKYPNILAFNRHVFMDFPATSEETMLTLAGKQRLAEQHYVHARLQRFPQSGSPAQWISRLKQLRGITGEQDVEVNKLTSVLMGRQDEQKQMTGDEYADFISKFSVNVEVLDKNAIAGHLRTEHGDQAVPIDEVINVINNFRLGDLDLDDSYIIKKMEQLSLQGETNVSRDDIQQDIMTIMKSGDASGTKEESVVERDTEIVETWLEQNDFSPNVEETMHLLRDESSWLRQLNPYVFNFKVLTNAIENALKNAERYNENRVEGDLLSPGFVKVNLRPGDVLFNEPKVAMRHFKSRLHNMTFASRDEFLTGEEWALKISVEEIPEEIIDGDTVRATFEDPSAPAGMNGDQFSKLLTKLFEEQEEKGSITLPDSAPSSTNNVETLYIVEAQSDWHQQGRDRGYNSLVEPADAERMEVLRNRSNELDEIINNARRAEKEESNRLYNVETDKVRRAMAKSLPERHSRTGGTIYDHIFLDVDKVGDESFFLGKPRIIAQDAGYWRDQFSQFPKDPVAKAYIAERLDDADWLFAGTDVMIRPQDLLRDLYEFEQSKMEKLDIELNNAQHNSLPYDHIDQRGLRSVSVDTPFGVVRIEDRPYVRDDEDADDASFEQIQETVDDNITEENNEDDDALEGLREMKRDQYEQGYHGYDVNEDVWREEDRSEAEEDWDQLHTWIDTSDEDVLDEFRDVDGFEITEDQYYEDADRTNILSEDDRYSWIDDRESEIWNDNEGGRIAEWAQEMIDNDENNGELTAYRWSLRGVETKAYFLHEYDGSSYYRVFDKDGNAQEEFEDENEAKAQLAEYIVAELQTDRAAMEQFLETYEVEDPEDAGKHGVMNLMGRINELFSRQRVMIVDSSMKERDQFFGGSIPHKIIGRELYDHNAAENFDNFTRPEWDSREGRYIPDPQLEESNRLTMEWLELPVINDAVSFEVMHPSPKRSSFHYGKRINYRSDDSDFWNSSQSFFENSRRFIESEHTEIIAEAIRERDEVRAERQPLVNRTNGGGIPDAPFKNEAAPELLVRMAILKAVQRGTKSLAWSKGITAVKNWGNYESMTDVKWEALDRGRRWKINYTNSKGNDIERILTTTGLQSDLGDAGTKIIEQYSGGDETGEVRTGPAKAAFIDQYDKVMVRHAAKIVEAYGGRPPELRKNVAGHEAWYLDIPEAMADAFLEQRDHLPLFQAQDNTDDEGGVLNGQRPPRGAYDPTDHKILLSPAANASTYIHEQSHAHMHLLVRRSLAGDTAAQRDVEVILEWFGVDSLDQVMYHKDDTDEVIKAKEKYHEQFADGFILYMAEGQAPSQELKVIFDKFRDFLVEITKKLMETVGFELSDEVREVYGRMVHNEADLSAARDVLLVNPISQEQLGMNDAQYAKYKSNIGNAVTEARRSLDAQVGKKANQVKSTAYKKRKSAMTKLVNEELSNEPVYQLRSLLMTPTSTIKLNTEEVKREMEGEPKAAEILRKTKSAYNKTGEASGLLLAEDYGFATLYDMLRAMSEAGPKAKESKRRVEERMKVEELTDPNIARLEDFTTDEAVDAMHNAAWENTILSEITALEQTTGKKRAFPVSSLKVNAARLVASVRLKDLKPGLYLRAERKNANAALRALERGDRELALQEKSRQLLNQYLYREASTQRKRADKALIKMQKLNTVKGRAGIDATFLPHIAGILGRFDLRKNAKIPGETLASADETRDFVAGPENLESLVNQGEAVRINDDNPIYSDAPTPWHQLTVEEFDTFTNAILNLVTIGKSISTVRLNDEVMDLEETAGKIEAVLVENVKEKKSSIPKDGPKLSLLTYWTELRKRRNIARKMDGFEDNGPSQDTLIANMSRVQGTEESRLGIEFEKLREIFARYNLNAKTMNKKRTFANGKLELTTEQILAVALNYGNEANRQRITESVGFYLEPGRQRLEEEDGAGQVVQEIIGAVTDEQWSMVEEVWAYLEGYWSEIAALEQRTTGVIPDKVEHLAFTTPTGRKMRGGYYPIAYDGRVTNQSKGDAVRLEALQNMSGFAGSAMTSHGHAKQRVGSGGRIVKMELSVMFNHVGQVVHDLTHRETLVGIHRILREPNLAAEMQGRLGQDDYNQWMNWIQRTATGDERASSSVEQWAGKLRGRVTIMGMGLNFSTAALQLMGLTQSQQKIGGKWVGAAMAEYMTNIHNLREWRGAINEKSSIMTSRGETFNRDVRELGRQVSKSKELSVWESAMFAPIVAMQSVVDGITWTASYNKAVYQGETEEKSIQLADADVAITQGSGRISDLAGIEGGRPFLKLFTTFYSFMNTMFNLSTDEAQRIWRDDKPLALKMVKSTQAVFLVYILPATMTNYVLDILIAGEEPEDEKEWLKWIGQNNMNYFVGQFPFFKEFIPNGYRHSGPAGLKFFENLNRGIASSIDLLPGGDPFGGDDVDGLFEDPLAMLDSSDSRAIIDALGVAAPLPTVEMKRLISGLLRIQEGETEGPVDSFTGLLFRKAR